MGWKHLLGWQLVISGALWAASVGWWLEEPTVLLARWPSAAELVLRDPGLVQAWQFAPLMPGVLAVGLGIVFLLAARQQTVAWEEFWD